MQPEILSGLVGWARAHHLYSLEFEERGVTLWTSVRTWEKDTFRRVAVAVQTVSPAMPHTICQNLGQLWLLWVVWRPLLLFPVGGMCWLTLTASIWEVGTNASMLSTQSSNGVS